VLSWCLFAAEIHEGRTPPSFEVPFAYQQGERGQIGFTYTEEEPENVLIKLQGFLRYL